MLSLTIKDIREAFSDTLFKFYSLSDFTMRGTKTKDKDKEFRIEFRIYDSEFWMDIDPSIDSIHIGTRSFGGPDHLDTIQMWLSKPFDYDKDNFQFGWRTDLEEFFDAFRENLLEKVKETQKTTAASVYGSSTKVDEPKSVVAQCIDAVYGKANETKDETKATKPSIFNGLDDQEDRDEYI
jgi:hypothetical protein